MRDSLVTWCGEKYVVDREFETIAYFGWVFPGGASLCFEKFIFLEAEMSGIFMISRQYLRIFVDQGENESKRNFKKFVKIILSTIFACNYLTCVSSSNSDNTWRIENFFLPFRERMSRNEIPKIILSTIL